MVAFDISQQKVGAPLESFKPQSTKFRGQAGQTKLITQVYPLYFGHVTLFLPRFLEDHGREKGILFTFVNPDPTNVICFIICFVTKTLTTGWINDINDSVLIILFLAHWISGGTVLRCSE